MEINSNTNFNYGQKLLALILITGVFCSVAWLSPGNKENKMQQASKIKEKIYDKKKIGEEKLESVIVKQSDNKVQSITVRSQSKKDCPKARTSKELNDLNLKQIAATGFNRMNMLLQESKKEIITKKTPKFNLNKLLFAQRSNTPSSFGNGMAMQPFRSEFSDVSFAPQLAYSMDYQKLQADWDKAQFSFSFDCEEMQNAVKKVMNSKQLQSLMHLPQHMKNADIEKMIKDELQKEGDKNVKSIPGKLLPRIALIPKNQSFYIVDETDPEVKIIKERTTSTGRNSKSKSDEDKNMQEPNASAYAYTYEVGNSNNENRTTRVFSRVMSNTKVQEGKSVPATPEFAPRTYKIIYNNENPAKTNAPKPSVPVKDNFRLEYKNGAVVINGKKLEVNEVNEMLTQVSLKVKKLNSRAKDLIEPHIED